MFSRTMVIFLQWFCIKVLSQTHMSPDLILLKDLMLNHSLLTRPAMNATTPVHSEKEQSLRTRLHIYREWSIPELTWNPQSYSGLEEIVIKKSRIWAPPVHLLNGASKIDGEMIASNLDDAVVVTYEGKCSTFFSQFYKSTCEIDVSYFPFDAQTCALLFGSWSMHDKLLILQNININAIDEKYTENGEWILRDAITQLRKVRYSVQTKEHSVVILKLHLERKYHYFCMTLLFPCALIASMIFCVFILPPKCGERISLGITVMLSMAIFQELSSRKLPSSSDNYPLLGIYYTTSMFELGIALVFNCVFLNLYYRNYEMPAWFRKFVLEKLAKVVFVKPDEENCNEDEEKENCLEQSEVIQNNNIRQHPVLRRIKTLDHCPTLRNQKSCETNEFERSSTSTLKKSKSLESINSFMESSESIKTNQQKKPPLPWRRSNYLNLLRQQSSVSSIVNSFDSTMTSSESLAAIVPNIIQFEKMKHDRQRHKDDWKKATRVLDRTLLSLAIFVGIISVLCIFIQAPRFKEIF